MTLQEELARLIHQYVFGSQLSEKKPVRNLEIYSFAKTLAAFIEEREKVLKETIKKYEDWGKDYIAAGNAYDRKLESDIDEMQKRIKELEDGVREIIAKGKEEEGACALCDNLTDIAVSLLKGKK